MEHILLTGGGAALIGLAIGYALKKFVKITLFIIGCCLILLFAAESYNIVTVSDQGLTNAGNSLLGALGNLLIFFKDRLTQFPIATVGAVVGLWTGFKQG